MSKETRRSFTMIEEQIDSSRELFFRAFEKARVQVPSSYSSEEPKQRPGEALDASWNEGKKIVFECFTSTTTKNYKAVADVLYGLGLDNAQHYRSSAVAYAAEAKQLPYVR
jgi:hypothetical protein